MTVTLFNKTKRFVSLVLDMLIKPTLLLFAIVIGATTIKAQSYKEQYEKCSETLRKRETVDSIYFELVRKRDSCLIGTIAPNQQNVAWEQG